MFTIIICSILFVSGAILTAYIMNKQGITRDYTCNVKGEG